MLSKIKRILFIKIDKKWGRKLAISLVILAALITIANEAYYWLGSEEDFYSEDYPADVVEDNCNVMGIELHGDLYTYVNPEDRDADGVPIVDQTASENVVTTINGAEADDTIKLILLEVDSYGGQPVAGEEIANALKNADKPTIALIRGAGTSAAYWAATGADIIMASKNSDVGGIGVTMSYLDNVRQNQTNGLTYNNLSAGKYKDYGIPDKVLTLEEKRLFQRDLDIMHRNFIQAVAENRELDIKAVERLADGSTVLGEMALKDGLIDQIGGMSDIKQYIKNMIGIEPEICW